jgi:hypothetical protein
LKVMTRQQIEKLFGKFTYREGRGGAIVITDKEWKKRNVVGITFPIVGRTWCHREVFFDLHRIFYELEHEGYADKIDVKDYRKQGGCYVPRHTCWNSRKGLSHHSWGIAIDLNVSTNGYGKTPTMPKVIIEKFAKYGWLWGGNFRTPDGMHFEVSDQWKPFRPVMPRRK